MALDTDYLFILREFNWTGDTNGDQEHDLSDQASPIPTYSLTLSGGYYTLNYHFLTSYTEAITEGYSSGSYEALHFDQTNSYQQSAVSAILHAPDPTGFGNFFGDVAKIDFSETSLSTANITLGQIDSTSFYGQGNSTIAALTYNYNPSPSSQPGDSTNAGLYGDIWLNMDFGPGILSSYIWNSANTTVGQIGFQTIVHELGHALGLDHPINAVKNGLLPSTEDSMQYSTMSSNDLLGMFSSSSSVVPSGLQLLDIAAIQAIYGINYDTRNTATTYDSTHGFSSGPFIYTIWDGGGADTIDASSYSHHVLIDLRQGAFSSIGSAVDTSFNGGTTHGFVYDVGQAKNNVAIAFHTVIENATGTSSDDYLIGNAWGNTLNGGDGNDHLFGSGTGYDGDIGFITGISGDTNDPNNSVPTSDDDTLNGGNGNDWLDGGTGTNTLNGGSGTDTVDYHDATSAVTVDLSITSSQNTFGSTHDTIINVENVRGSDYNDTLSGTSSSNIIYGSKGNDTLDGVSGAYNFDIVDYGYLASGISVTATGNGQFTVAKGASGVLGSDDLTNITQVTGSSHNDTFTGISNPMAGVGSYYEAYSGGAGNDHYNFDLSVDSGSMRILEDSASGIDTITITNFNSSTMTAVVQYIAAADEVVLNVGDFSSGNHVSLSLGYGSLFAGTGVEYLVINGTTWNLGSIATYLAEESYTDIDYAHWMDSYSYNFYHSDGAGGVLPSIEPGSGAITGISYSPTISSGIWVPYYYGTEILHTPVITAFTAGGGSFSFTTESYVKEIDFHSGITPDKVRLTLSGSQGDMSLQIHIDDLGQTFTIPYFETGKTIHGIALYDTSLHSFVQGATTESTSSGGGGTFYESGTSGSSPSVTSSSFDVTYYLEKLAFASGSPIDLTGALTFEGTSTSDALYGLDNRGDTIYGYAGGDTIYGYGGDDTLYGGDGTDSLIAGAGADILVGGAGADYLTGGTGNDTYEFSAGDGSDIVFEYTGEGTDTIRMNGYNEADVRLYTDTSGNLHIISIADASDNITVNGGVTYYSGTSYESTIGDYVEQIVFDDGTLSLGGALTIQGTGSNETLYGTQYGDTIYGMAGADSIIANRGDDTLIGGAGADYLTGGVGNDTYVFAAGDGADTIVEYTSEGTDTIRMNGFNAADVRLYTDYSGNLHIVSNADATDNITVYGAVTYYSGTSYESTVGQNVEQIVFDDTTVSLTGALTIHGSSTNDTLYGTQYDDTIYGMAATDSLIGNRGSDTLIGGTGADYLVGGVGDDTYVFSAGDGADTIVEYTSEGADTIRMNGFNAADVRLYTDYSGNLHIVSSADASDNITVYGAVTYYSGTSYESTVGQNVEQIVFDDTTVSLTGALTLQGTSSADTLYGTQYNDTIYGLGGTDSLIGNRGDDKLTGGAGADYLYGGTGNDTYQFSAGDGADTIVEYSGEGTDTIRMNGYNAADVRFYTDTSGYLHIVSNADASDNIIIYTGTTGTSGTSYELAAPSVEQITFDDGTVSLTGALTFTGTNSSDSLYGTQYNDTINGLAGNDSLFGNSGNDTLTGGAGTDYLYGGTGNDTYQFSSGDGADTISENPGEGTDTIRMNGYDAADVHLYTDTSGYLHIVSNANAADNIIVYSGTTSASGTTYEFDVPNVEQIVFDDGAISLTGGLTMAGSSGGEGLYGTQYNDTISGLGGNDTLYGNRGNDTLIGGAGTDYLSGGVGNDTYQFSAGDGADTISENPGEGTDTIRMNGFDAADARFYTDTSGYLHVVSNANSSDNLTMYIGTTSASGTSYELDAPNVEQITFDDGTVSLTGGLSLSGTSSGEGLYGTQYNDTINGMAGNDTLYGNRGNDTIYGGDGSDYISGGAGNDTLHGQAGVDTLYGDGGADIFAFEATTAFAAQDTIQDFNTSEGDAIDIHDLLVGFNPLTSAIHDFVSLSTSSGNTILSVDRDGSGGTYSAQAIVTISGVTGLDVDDLYTHGHLIAA